MIAEEQLRDRAVEQLRVARDDLAVESRQKEKSGTASRSLFTTLNNLCSENSGIGSDESPMSAQRCNLLLNLVELTALTPFEERLSRRPGQVERQEDGTKPSLGFEPLLRPGLLAETPT